MARAFKRRERDEQGFESGAGENAFLRDMAELPHELKEHRDFTVVRRREIGIAALAGKRDEAPAPIGCEAGNAETGAGADDADRRMFDSPTAADFLPRG